MKISRFIEKLQEYDENIEIIVFSEEYDQERELNLVTDHDSNETRVIIWV